MDLEEHYKRLFELTEKENRNLTAVLETQKRLIAELEQEKEILKAAYQDLNGRFEKIMALCDQQQQLLDEMIGSIED